jgi:glutamate synthase (NADPH) large chain
MTPTVLKDFPLYDPRNEHDACGIGFIVNVNAERSHETIMKGIQILVNLAHRGASGSDPKTGDGAGITIQIPHKFFVKECGKLGLTLPPEGEYGVGMLFLPVEPQPRFECEAIIERIVQEEGLSMVGWRDTPLDADAIGRVARVSQPYIEQVFIRTAPGMTPDEFERKLYIVRKRAETEVAASNIQNKNFFYVPSLSSRTIIYKGLLIAPQIARFYKELSDPDTMSALCLVHQRFSTNTFPSWQLAHPFRYLCHNGEINTLRGNVNWMHARQSVLKSAVFGNDIEKLFPIIQPGVSDSAALDNAVELMTMSGRSLPHAMTILIPEAWDADVGMSPAKRAFYEYHASLMEPWDGPAAVAFTDGRVIGATLDRNGLRPARYLVTHDNFLIMASEAGVLDIEPENVKYKGCLEPGNMLLADLTEKRIIPDKEIKTRLAKRQPYAQWIQENQIRLDQLPEPPREIGFSPEDLLKRQRAF